MLAKTIPLSWKLTDSIVLSKKLLGNKSSTPSSIQQGLQEW